MTKNEAMEEVKSLSKGITHDAAQLLELLGTGAVQLPIGDTDKYVVVGTLAMIAKVLPSEQSTDALGEFAGYDLDTGEPLVTWYDRAAMPRVGDRLCVCRALPLAAPAPQSDEPVAELDEFTKRSIREYGDFREDVERLSTADSRTRKALRKEIYDTIDARVRNAVKAALTTQAATAAPVRAEPERMSTDESREYLVKFMEQHFTDKTFHRYIRADETRANVLAGDFAWQMARALRMIQASPAPHPSEQAVRDQALEDAAKVCDRLRGGDAVEGAAYWDAAADECAICIRSLRTQSTGQASEGVK